MGQYGGAPAWWEAGSNERMPFSSVFQNKTGDLLVYNAAGETTAGTHPFFTPMGANGRGCITCHQLSNAMSVSPDRLQDRWVATTGRDAVFEAIDGSNCPDLPQHDRASHSLLLHRGVFRIYQQWPAAGVKPEFTVEVVRDPTGCNTSAKYGLRSAQPSISVYRRPRMTANLKYLTAGNAFTADSRATTLEAQAMDALRKHEQGTSISNEDLKQIVDFEREIYVAQGRDDNAGDVSSFGAPSLLGTWNLARAKADAPSDGHMLAVADWAGPANAPNAGFRRSVERGSFLFNSRTFPITETANLHGNLHNTTGKAPVAGTCATCHSERMTGANTQQAWMDIGTSSLPWAGDQKDLPLFKITCSASATPHPYLGRVIYTNDPGRALVTGKCADVGSLVMQQLRGLTARAPYFTGGSAKDLRAVVDFYDKRFSAHYTETEKQDLVNFMSVL
jgi:cytochrome c peroxidase